MNMGKTKAKKADGVYISEMYRFGYVLYCVGRTRDEAFNAMSEEYIRTYAKYKELDEQSLRDALVNPPLNDDGEIDEWDPRNFFAIYYREAMEDAEPRFREYGVVEWG